MKLRIIKPEGYMEVGDIIEPEMDGAAQLYIERGIAERATEPFPPPNKMVKPANVKRKAAENVR